MTVGGTAGHDRSRDLANHDASGWRLQRGATDAECTWPKAKNSPRSSACGSSRRLKDAGSRGAGLRVLIGQRVGSAYTSDLSAEGIRQLVDSAVEIAAIIHRRPARRAAGSSRSRRHSRRSAALLGRRRRYRYGLSQNRAGQARRRSRPRRRSAHHQLRRRLLRCPLGRAHLRQFARISSGSYRTSSCSLSAIPVAREGDSMERDYWYSSARRSRGWKAPPTLAGVPPSEPFAVWARAKCQPRKCP